MRRIIGFIAIAASILGQNTATINGVPVRFTITNDAAIGLLTVTAVIDLVAVPDGTCVLDTTAVTVTGAALGGRPLLGVSIALPEGVNLFPKVTGPNTMKIEVCNFSGASYNPASATFKFGVQP